MTSKTNQNPQAVEAAIKARQTFKVMGDAESAVAFDEDAEKQNRAVVLDALSVSGWAPFHHARGINDLVEPWRAYVLWHDQCQALAPQLFDWFPSMARSSKIPKMMYACGALVLVTWIPEDVAPGKRVPKHDELDREHLLATGAMVQNFLLMLTAHGMGSYWSSGSDLGSEHFFTEVGIPCNQQLVAAVFVEYPESQSEERQRIPGKHRDKRSDRWIKEVVL